MLQPRWKAGELSKGENEEEDGERREALSKLAEEYLVVELRLWYEFIV